MSLYIIMINYNNSIIYKIYCKDENIKDFYIGSTTNLKRRIREHKSKCYNENRKSQKILYTCINNNGGFNNWEFKILCNKKLNNKKELWDLEREYILTNPPPLNVLLPYTTLKEKEEKWKKVRAIYMKKKYTCNICNVETLLVNKSQHERTIKHNKKIKYI